MALVQTRRPTRLSNPSLEDTGDSAFRGFGRLLAVGLVFNDGLSLFFRAQVWSSLSGLVSFVFAKLVVPSRCSV